MTTWVWILLIAAAFIAGILFNRWMCREPRRYRRDDAYTPPVQPTADDEVAKARMRGGAL